MLKRAVFLLLCVLLGILIGCGGGGGGGSSPRVKVTPSKAVVAPNAGTDFTVAVTGLANANVTWSISPNDGSATITPTDSTHARFQASATEQTYTITATSVADPTKSGKATVIVSNIQITTTPSPIVLGAGESVDISTNVTGTGNTNVTFSVDAGTLSNVTTTSVRYKAPLVAGTYTLTVHSAANPNVTFTFPITVNPISIDVKPDSVGLAPGATQDFTVAVTGANDPAVQWSATGGTITPTSATTAHYVAPSTAGTYSVTAKVASSPTFKDTSTVGVSGSTTLIGKVVQSGTSTGVSGLTIDVYDASSNLIGSGTTNASGNFTANLSGIPASWQIRNSSISSAYYKSYFYNGFWYSTLIAGCRVAITGHTGANVLVGNIQIPLSSGPPPPPPTGCGG